MAEGKSQVQDVRTLSRSEQLPSLRRETLGGGVESKEHGLWTKNLSFDDLRIKLNHCSKVPNSMLAINNND